MGDQLIMTPELAQSILDTREACQRELRRREIESAVGSLQAWRETEILIEDNRPLYSVIAPFQRKRFAFWDGHKQTYCESCVGSSKTTDVSAWILSQIAHRTGWEAAIFAVDADQARKILQAANGMILRNPRLRTIWGLDVQRSKIVSAKTGSYCTVESNDVPSAEGLLVDCAILEQLESWRREDMWISIMSRSLKRKMQIHIIANAPSSMDHFSIGVRSRAHEGDWTWLQVDADEVPWYTPEALATLAGSIPAPAFARLYHNVIGHSALALFTPEQVELITALEGPSGALPPDCRRSVLSLDMGLTHDLAVLSVIGEHVDGSQDLLDMLVFAGSTQRPVQFEDVSDALFRFRSIYKPDALIYDPWQLEQKAGELRRLGLPSYPYRFTAASVNDLAHQIWRRGIDRGLRIYRGAGAMIQRGEPWDLAREMTTVELVETPLGFKLENKGTTTKDRVISVGMASIWMQRNASRIALGPIPLTEYLRRLGAQ